MKLYNAIKYFEDYLNSLEFEEYINESYWLRNFNEDKVFEKIANQAIEDGLYLDNLEELAPQIYKLITTAYDSAEKEFK